MSSGMNLRIILGSASRTRQAILKEMGYAFEVETADIDEKAIRKSNAQELVMALAHAKADALLARLKVPPPSDDEQVLLITADQVVVHEGQIREKPESAEEARLFIEGYGRSPASTVGSVLVTNLRTQKRYGGFDSTEIYFHKIPQEVVESLIKEGSVYYAAGGLMIENPLVSPLVESVVGTIDSVMGLPKALTRRLIEEALEGS
ncbi:putative tropinone reductase [Klebsormidium nitens]|uniref:Putative tropinone reductase n=1 Tax=Klebsormidium nitens TaxID=105231 RepID=A0A1Y1IQN9_KLENI|nr:putative tropinone reductase [Klebsormidium nitens]|eukprot:GAQ90937.1 putative tropinone reductase [Klebsormidium nitens]